VVCLLQGCRAASRRRTSRASCQLLCSARQPTCPCLRCWISRHDSPASLYILKDGQSGFAASTDAGPHVAMPLYVLLQDMLTKCRKFVEAGEAVISRRGAATRGIAAALQVGWVCRQW
jgi:hypothetical protein